MFWLQRPYIYIYIYIYIYTCTHVYIRVLCNHAWNILLLLYLRPVMKVNMVDCMTVPLGSWLEAAHVYWPWSVMLADCMVSVLWTYVLLTGTVDTILAAT